LCPAFTMDDVGRISQSESGCMIRPVISVGEMMVQMLLAEALAP